MFPTPFVDYRDFILFIVGHIENFFFGCGKKFEYAGKLSTYFV